MRTALRAAAPADIPFILDNIRGLAEVEGRPDLVTITPARLTEILFSPAPRCRCFIIEFAGAGPVGHAWVYSITPTFTGTDILYLEDLYIRDAHRGRGAGREAMVLLAALATREGCAGMDWSMLDSNTAAAKFYARLGATIRSGGVSYRLSGEAFAALAREVDAV